MDASPYCYAYTRELPSGAEHAEVGFVTPLSAHSYEAGLGLVTRGLCRMAHTKMVILFREKGYFFSKEV